MKKPVPVATPDSRPFWNGLAEHKLLLKHCGKCSKLFHYPRVLCPECLSSDLEWRAASGKATLYTYTISRRPTHPLFAGDVPQYLAVVELEEGPRITSTLVDVPEDNITIGMALEPVFERDEANRITLLRFRPADEGLRGERVAEAAGASAPLLSEACLDYIGKTGESIAGYPICAEEIRRFCYATDDLNPRFLDPGFAAGGVIAPPMFLSIPFDTDAPLSELAEDGVPLSQKGLVFPPLDTKRKLFGGYQVEYFAEMRPGDVLSRQRRILDIYARQGSSGRSIFVLIEAIYTNQRGEKVAVEVNTIINR